jgi:hypothetical protein
VKPEFPAMKSKRWRDIATRARRTFTTFATMPGAVEQWTRSIN